MSTPTFVVVLDAGFVRIAAGKRRRAGRLTDRIRAIGARETHAVGGQAVDVRRVDILVTDDATHRVREPMIGHDDEDVGTIICANGRNEQRRDENDKEMVFH